MRGHVELTLRPTAGAPGSSPVEVHVAGEREPRDLLGLTRRWRGEVPERHRRAGGAVGGLVTATPVGELGVRLVARGDRPLEARYGPPGPWLAEVDVQLAVTWAQALRWLHDDVTTLGNLIVEGAMVDGDLYALSAVEGLLGAPGPPRLAPQAVRALLRAADRSTGRATQGR